MIKNFDILGLQYMQVLVATTLILLEGHEDTHELSSKTRIFEASHFVHDFALFEKHSKHVLSHAEQLYVVPSLKLEVGQVYKQYPPDL
jgi:hypothetical protein